MNDPRVALVTYRLDVGENVHFNSPPRLDRETEHFTVAQVTAYQREVNATPTDQKERRERRQW